MLLEVRRKWFTAHSTIGELYVDGHFECYTLEDTFRTGPKVPGSTAIPCGEYKVIVTWSPHFSKNLPLLVSVPNFDGVRIHSGNTEADTEGCILVGTNKEMNVIEHSKVAFDALFPKIKAALPGVRIKVTNEGSVVSS